ncbi:MULTISPECIES: AMP-binding protein [unclassified Mycolicibacterium]|uniref:AMP-binding protein n=1 Tax=unclassified Mycolicibacterium TaxID=2636767 RepID=UPI0012DFCB98|nr:MULTISPECIES: AMP-binding protein [unclassified Mycolicibacterium]MUL80524.1 AMP-binding protein [Mycolicibacterium sp. CBMA 329]MUL86291.1 AMP-binding protein [Mycolicibacterium sp. CBMA 331]MUM01048.1 AMP-binding protein [Mycolicibacterium sp. CBMA 334]MUM36587.1 AMP-binding protein [Mycolicibacterium sp. CBMA 247]MUM42355.1 AMP-binding protein [Mycolicibacterium sp. CBMA 294]
MKDIIDLLRAHGDRIAVVTETRQVTYRALAGLVSEAAGALGPGRRLVLLEARNDLPTLVHYLGALAGGHVSLPVPAGGDHRAILQTYSPDTVVDAAGIHHRRTHGTHRLHDELALLMSTSGSTGSPKLVRLSCTNLISNATAIAEYLGISETDRAATTLPVSYCYGLSVVNSHLLRGAGLILTDRSVVDDEFWELFTRHRATTFAGVPHTFDLLDRIGFDTMDLPHLRYITQAGGRMAPDRVRHFAALGQRLGWQLFVMYGATEATARMAYLPPELASSRPESIGRPIPGGHLSILPGDAWPDGTGELVYRGANVMLGYAQRPEDLALGAAVEELHTGDIARRTSDGLYEIIGRSTRFVKLFGLRIDLDRLQAGLAERGVTALCTEDGGTLAVAAVEMGKGTPNAGEVRRLTATLAGVPAGAVRAAIVAELPRLVSGKPDYEAVRALAANAPITDASDLRDLFAEVLHIRAESIDRDASFVELGGNSLSYVAMSVRLERTLGRLPKDWHRMPLCELESDLERSRTPRARRGAAVETSVALRAAAIVLIVGSHAGLFQLWGGAHVLLGVAGYNFGRFCLTPVPRWARLRHLRDTIGWIAAPSIVWVAVALVLTDDYHASNLLLANKFLGPHDSMTAGRLWFVEVLVWILVALAAVCALPAGDRLERRRPFGFAAVFLTLGLVLRYDLPGLGLGREAWFTVLAFWFFAAGWAAAKSTATWQRVIVTVVLIVGLHGYFGNNGRETLVMAGFTLLIWLPSVRCPVVVAAGCGVLAEASLYIYLTHYQVYPLFGDHRALGVLAALVVGVVLTYLVNATRKRLAGTRPHRSGSGRIAVGDQTLLHQRGCDGPVGSDQARRDDAATTRCGR